MEGRAESPNETHWTGAMLRAQGQQTQTRPLPLRAADDEADSSQVTAINHSSDTEGALPCARRDAVNEAESRAPGAHAGGEEGETDNKHNNLRKTQRL